MVAATNAAYEVIVVGAGVAGCAMAYTMASQGRNVLLVERDLSEPDRIVGELLQPGGLLALQTLGLGSAVEGIDAINVNGYVLLRNDRNDNSSLSTCLLPYPMLESGLPAVGKSFHHGKFIEGLRRACRKQFNLTLIEATATKLIHDKQDDSTVIGVSVAKKQHPSENSHISFFAPLTVVADGLYSKFRKTYLGTTMQAPSQFFGLVLHDIMLPHPNHGHVVLAHPSPILLYQIGTKDTRILIDLPKQEGVLKSSTTLTETPSLPEMTRSDSKYGGNTKTWKLQSLKASDGSMQSYMREQVAPQLPISLQSAFLDALATQRLRSMPNPYLPSIKQNTRGLILLGDAHNMRHPLTGAGMTAALNDVVILCRLLCKEQFSSFEHREVDVCKAVKRWYWERKNLSSVINIMANALYSLFSAGNDSELEFLQEATFRYLSLGGQCTNGPMGLLSCILPRPLVLLYHFFAVALLAIYCNIKATTWRRVPQTLAQNTRILHKAGYIIGPLVWYEVRGAPKM